MNNGLTKAATGGTRETSTVFGNNLTLNNLKACIFVAVNQTTKVKMDLRMDGLNFHIFWLEHLQAVKYTDFKKRLVDIFL